MPADALAVAAPQLGISTNFMQLWGQAIESERQKLQDEQFFAGESGSVQAEILTRILVRLIVSWTACCAGLPHICCPASSQSRPPVFDKDYDEPYFLPFRAWMSAALSLGRHHPRN